MMLSDLALVMPMFDLLLEDAAYYPAALLLHPSAFCVVLGTQQGSSSSERTWQQSEVHQLLDTTQEVLQDGFLGAALLVEQCSDQVSKCCCNVLYAVICAAHDALPPLQQQLQVQPLPDAAVQALLVAVRVALSAGITRLLIGERVLQQLGKQLQQCGPQDQQSVLRISLETIADIQRCVGVLYEDGGGYTAGVVTAAVKQGQSSEDIAAATAAAAAGSRADACGGSNPLAAALYANFTATLAANAAGSPAGGAAAAAEAAAGPEAAVRAKFWSPSIVGYPVTLVGDDAAT
jgi:hypothetical protein